MHKILAEVPGGMSLEELDRKPNLQIVHGLSKLATKEAFEKVIPTYTEIGILCAAIQAKIDGEDFTRAYHLKYLASENFSIPSYSLLQTTFREMENNGIVIKLDVPPKEVGPGRPRDVFEITQKGKSLAQHFKFIAELVLGFDEAI